MSKQKQWKQGREMKHADAWDGPTGISLIDGVCEFGEALAVWPGTPARTPYQSPYPPNEQPTDAIWIGSGDAV